MRRKMTATRSGPPVSPRLKNEDHMRFTRLIAVSAAALLLAAPAAFGQAYPTKPVKVVVPPCPPNAPRPTSTLVTVLPLTETLAYGTKTKMP